MKENPPSSEKKEEQNPRKTFLFRSFERYRNKPDKPKYSYEEQHKLSNSEETAPAFKEGKEDKKHISPIAAILAGIKRFLESEEASNISEKTRMQLLVKRDELFKDLWRAGEEKYISDELVTRFLSFMDEVESFIK